ncbi:multidrug effflux MFS transporter [Altericroceibacterium endophyticum]|uniref:MFS transporter n=1 Tax=Altericroceibacterium endophyticum TaxID=1808508 RepID=A0A6I4TAV7_9SPHN|nr:multidrug effflux MFS transporter [Altericroceibacterium endophyticum]MXO67000.1 MFS transporter [Altericroceibacterium endophyticum]
MSNLAIPKNKRVIGQRELVALTAFMMSLQALAIDAMLPALDEMARELGVAEGNQRQLVVAVFLLSSGVGALLPGSFADRFGRRSVAMFCITSYALLSLVIALIHDFTLLLVIRALQGVLSAGLMVLPATIIRDRYEGDQMARLLSLVGAVFIVVPVLAPSLGQAVLTFAGWRWIFVVLAAMAGMAGFWAWKRLPETLDPLDRQMIELPVVMRNMTHALLNRSAIGYVLGTSLLIGAVFGYVNSSQQLIGEHFGMGTWFPIVFGGTAAMMVLSNLVNSRIVERFGARRVSHTGVLAFIAVSALQVLAAFRHDGDIVYFLPLMATNLALLGFLGANFGSIAMQPFAHIAGAASSIQSFFRTFGAAVVGLFIGQSYDGTARPFAIALLICSVLALLLVLYSEKGRLFRRLNAPAKPETKPGGVY